MQEYSMNEEIKKYPVYALMRNGMFYKLENIRSTGDYNHFTHQMHHFIKRQEYDREREWFEERGIKQKLFLIPVWLHLIIHNNPAGMMLSDQEFKERFKISRWELLFNRRYTKY